MADTPNTGPSIREQVDGVIAERIRPAIQRDGGDIELVDVDEKGVVSVRLRGACSGCPGARMTLKMGVERLLKQVIPQVTEVVCVQP
jgi:Fe-S cluster biogenesis protein NfuA